MRTADQHGMPPAEAAVSSCCAAGPAGWASTCTGLSNGKMLPANAAAIVGAGVLFVLLFPAAATALARKSAAQGAPEAAEVSQQAQPPLDNRLPWHR